MSIPKVKRYENGKEIVGQIDTPYEITWDEWQLLTDTEKEKHKWLITDVPGADGFITIENMKLLWSNPSPTASFASQNITLASDDYDFLLIITATSSGSGNGVNTDIAPKGSIIYCNIAIGNGSQIRSRQITPVNTTTLSVDTGYSNGTANTGVVIPQAIYGFKKQTEIRFNALAQNVKATVDYSTDEHPIGTWIDGSTLYEKTIDCGTLPSSATKQVLHGISNISRVCKIEGIAVETNGTTYKNIPFTVPSGTGNISVYIDHTKIYIQTSNDQSAYTGYVTLRYTKTT